MTYPEGIDVSKWQESTPDLSGRSFLFARASVGLHTDGAYAQHIAQARREGLIVGAYHFAYGSQPMVDQADLFTHAAGDVDLYVIDVEGNDAPTKAQVARFIARVKRNKPGKKVGLYMSQSPFYTSGTGADFNWVARWGITPPSIPWTFWQYTSDGRIAGYSGRIDLDRFNGTEAQLRAFAGHPLVPADTSPGGANVAIRYAQPTATASQMTLPKGTVLYEKPGGKRVTSMSRTVAVPHVGLAGSVNGHPWRAVIVSTRWSYSDGKAHRTVLYVPASAGKVTP